MQTALAVRDVALDDCGIMGSRQSHTRERTRQRAVIHYRYLDELAFPRIEQDGVAHAEPQQAGPRAGPAEHLKSCAAPSIITIRRDGRGNRAHAGPQGQQRCQGDRVNQSHFTHGWVPFPKPPFMGRRDWLRDHQDLPAHGSCCTLSPRMAPNGPSPACSHSRSCRCRFRCVGPRRQCSSGDRVSNQAQTVLRAHHHGPPPTRSEEGHDGSEGANDDQVVLNAGMTSLANHSNCSRQSDNGRPRGWATVTRLRPG